MNALIPGKYYWVTYEYISPKGHTRTRTLLRPCRQVSSETGYGLFTRLLSNGIDWQSGGIWLPPNQCALADPQPSFWTQLFSD